MIKIDKGPPPKILIKRGGQETAKLRKQYQDKPNQYNSGKKRFTFNSSIYSSDEVKCELRSAQKGKCCYTEAKLEDVVHVEHFRPKKSWRNDSKTLRAYPGYFWLAYDWQNLILSNPKVNNFKSDIFPLLDPNSRARPVNGNINNESIALIDPTRENPREHIRFYRDEPYGITDRGKITIETLKLRDSSLREKRMRRLKYLETLIMLNKALRSGKLAVGVNTGLANINYELDNARQAESEFSSMAIDFLSAD